MHSFSDTDCRSGWSKELKWENDYGIFLPCFSTSVKTSIF
jgi:hypothetical protein